MKRILALCAFFLLNVSVYAQFGVPGQSGIEKPVSSWNYTIKPATAKVGDVVELYITANVQEGWHVFSSESNPKLEFGPITTTVSFKKNDGFELVGKLKSIGARKKYEEVYEGDVYLMPRPAVFIQKIKILADSPKIAGTVEGQACTDNDGKCVQVSDDFSVAVKTSAAATVPATATATTASASVSAPVSATVVSATTAPEAVAATTSADTVTESVAPAPESITGIAAETAAGTEGDSMLGFIIAAFLSGLVALLTPCVFPIIPMTVSYFTHQKGGRWKAIIYGASIIGIYVLIGTLVSRINGPAFANFLSTHWVPNILFFAIFFTFGLSFLGLFEIVLPHSLVNSADAKAEKGGLMGIFFMAFTLVLVSFSCTGPIVGSLLVASAGGEVVKPIVGMMAFSSAFAIPFTLFAAFPQWLKSLPKSGGWLNSVKVLLGFLELALALKFLSIADQVYHWGLLDREVFLAFWIVIFSLIGFYLLGKIRLPHDSETKSVSVPRLLMAIITFAFVVYMVPGLWGAPLKALSGYLPPEASQDFRLTAGGSGASEPANALGEKPKYGDLFHLPHNLQGFFDYKQALAYAKKVNKPVFIDFTGHGCVNCREMEARVWSDPQVLSRLKEDYVVVALYVDDKTELPESDWYTSTYDQKQKTTIGAQNGDLQIVKYNNNAQPHYCLVDHEGKLLVAPKNYDRDINNFVQFLDAGKAKFNGKG